MKAYEPGILQFIPQRPPFVMVDQLLHTDDHSASSIFQVRAENIFVEERELAEAGLIENIAQTAAARIGYICQQEKRPVPLGYIGAVQNLEIIALPKINDQIETEISIKNQIFDVTIISGTVQCKGMVLARCDMKIFISTHPKNL
jgi:predicted hotdog family 3-hydroxylacyl-ACP dehydratase